MRYIALLRGINVSGQKIIKMEHLRTVFESMQFQQVVTFIQSGNVLFNAPQEEGLTLEQKIEEQLLDSFGFGVPVFVRSIDQWRKMLEQNPFADKADEPGIIMNITFLQQLPKQDKLQKLMALNDQSTVFFHLEGLDVFSLIHRDANGQAPYPNMVIEKVLKQPATTRNWATVNKMASL